MRKFSAALVVLRRTALVDSKQTDDMGLVVTKQTSVVKNIALYYIFVYILCNFFDDPSFLLGKMLVVVHFPSLAPKSVNTLR